MYIDAIRKIISNEIFPLFEELNYEREGDNFKYYNKDEDIGKIVYLTGDDISIVPIVGIYIPEFEYYFSEPPKNKNFTISDCVIIKTMCGMGGHHNKWYCNHTEDDCYRIKIKNDTKLVILPFLNKFINKRIVFEELLGFIRGFAHGSRSALGWIRELYHSEDKMGQKIETFKNQAINKVVNDLITEGTKLSCKNQSGRYITEAFWL